MSQTFTEKEILGDALAAQKTSTDHFNTFANECVHENVRQVMLDILEEEHNIQQDVFCCMHDKVPTTVRVTTPGSTFHSPVVGSWV